MCVLLFQIEEEEKKLKAAIEEAEKQYSEVSSEMKNLEKKSKEFEQLEERFVLSSPCYLRFRHKIITFTVSIKFYYSWM
jgi:DNA repair ATPase RecN